MKKVILALAIVSVSFVACNDGAKTEEPKTDSVAPTPAPVDTAKAPVADTTKAPVADTTKK
jgi:hypothetical protein